jgi:hypothetical protein
MNSAPEALPDDVAALRAMLVAAWAERDAEHAEKRKRCSAPVLRGVTAMG